MAGRNLGTLTVDLVAKIGGFVAGMTQAERVSKKRMDAMVKHAKALGVAFGAALTASAAAVAAGVKSAIDNADALDEMAQRTGIAVETLSRLQVVAKLGAIDMETLQKSVGRLAVRQQEYAEGNEDTVALFDALGVAAVDAEGRLRNADAVLSDLADVFASMPDGAQKTAIAMDLLGRSGQALIPFFNKGGDEFERLMGLADDLGIELSEDTARAASDVKDQFDLMSLAVDGLWQQVATNLLPDIKELSTEFTENATEGNKVALMADNVATGIRAVVWIADKAFTSVKALTLGFVGMAAGLAEFLATYTLIGRFATTEDQRQMLADLAAVGIGGSNEALTDLFGLDAPGTRPAGQGRGIRGGGPRSPQGATSAFDQAAYDAYTRRLKDKKEATDESAAADRAAAEAARELERADAELQRRLEELAKQHDDYIANLDDLEAQLAGPLAEAELEHKRRIDGLQEALDSTAISVDEATRAQMLYAEAFAKTKDELDPYGKAYRDLLADMELELDLLGMTNAARVTELELRRLGIDVSTEAGQAARDAIQARAEELEALHEQIDAMDDFRSSFEDNVASVLDGSKSIKDALRDMVDDFIAQLARMAAQDFTEFLFGQQGSGQTGAAGGWLSSLFGAFGGPKAAGGPVMAGVPYLVGEQGPELVIPKSAGTVIPAGQTAAMLGRGTVVNNFNMPGRYDLRTQAQVAADAGRGAQRALARGTA